MSIVDQVYVTPVIYGNQTPLPKKTESQKQEQSFKSMKDVKPFMPKQNRNKDLELKKENSLSKVFEKNIY